MKNLIFATVVLSVLASIAAPKARASTPLTVLCVVSEVKASTKESQTKDYVFDGSLREVTADLTLLSDMNIWLKGSPGSVKDDQAFYLGTRITDLSNNSKSVSESYFLKNQPYSGDFEEVIPGSHRAVFTRANGDFVEVSCINP